MKLDPDTPMLIFLSAYVIFFAYFCLAGFIHRQIGEIQMGGGPGAPIVVVAPLFPAILTAWLTYWSLSDWGEAAGGIVAAICMITGLVAMYWIRRGNSRT